MEHFKQILQGIDLLLLGYSLVMAAVVWAIFELIKKPGVGNGTTSWPVTRKNLELKDALYEAPPIIQAKSESNQDYLISLIFFILVVYNIFTVC